CPIVRYHPAVVAQMVASIALMSDGRFMLGLGAGENLNEHVVGKGWPPVHIRHQMLEEAIEVIRELWQGEYVSFKGEFFTVHDAKIFSKPPETLMILVDARGLESCDIAATSGDGLIAPEPQALLVKEYRDYAVYRAAYWVLVVCI